MLDVEVRWTVIEVPVKRIACLVSQSTIAIVGGDVHGLRVNVRSKQRKSTGKATIPVDLKGLVVGGTSGDVFRDGLKVGVRPARIYVASGRFSRDKDAGILLFQQKEM